MRHRHPAGWHGLARSAFNSSMHYRSAMILGVAQPVDDDLEALRVLTEHLLPGRWEVLREPTRKELAATLVLALPLREWSVKISDSPPEDEPDDLDDPVWAGVVPWRMVQETLCPPRTSDSISGSGHPGVSSRPATLA